MLTNYSADKLIAPPQSGDPARPAPEPGGDDNLFAGRDYITIESSNFISGLNFRDFWKYRELLYFLALRDVKIRYKQTVLGIGWVLLQPIVTTAIFSIPRSRTAAAVSSTTAI
jgi:lipopolysaccharide transport system permease protein